MEERKWEVENAKSSPVITECQFYYPFLPFSETNIYSNGI